MARGQRYVFVGPDGWAWVEVWESGRASYVPSPFREVEHAVKVIAERNPDDIVDAVETGTADYREMLAGARGY